MSVKLLTEHNLEFLCLKGGCTGSFESTYVKMPHCWKSYVSAHLQIPVRNACYLLLTTATVSSFSSAAQATWSVNCEYHSTVFGLQVFARIVRP